jgi:malonate transporter MadL subunit
MSEPPVSPAPLANETGGKIKTVIHGVALLAVCTLAGVYIGDRLGEAIGVKANVGGVGIAMILLVLARHALERRRPTSSGLRAGIAFWALMYVPIVVAMAATQNVVAAARGGPLVLIAGGVTVALSFVAVWLIIRLGGGAADRAEPDA